MTKFIMYDVNIIEIQLEKLLGATKKIHDAIDLLLNLETLF